MIINRIRATNFRNCVDAQLELATVNIVTGPNGAGKSTFVAAIEYALTGRCGWTDRAGRGSAGLLRADPGVISGAAEIESDIGCITRSVPSGSLQIEGKMGSARVLQDLIYEALGANADMISAALNAYQFADLPAKERSDMLFALAGLTFDGPAVRAELEKRDGCSENALQVFDALCPARLEGGAEVFDVLDDRTRDARRDVNRDLKAAQSALKLLPSPPQLPAGVTAEDAAAAQTTLDGLRGEERDALATRGAAEERARRLKTVEAGIATFDRLIELKTAAFKQAGVDPATSFEAADAAVEAARAEHVRLRSDYKTRFQAFEAEILALRGLRETFAQLAGAAGAPCPLAPEFLKCTAAPQDIAAVKVALEAEITRRTAEHQKVKEAVAEGGAAWQGVLEAERAEEKARDVRATLQVVAEARKNRSRLLADQKAILGKPAVATVTAQLDTLRVRLGIAQKTVDAQAVVDRYSLGREAIQDKIVLLAVQSDALDWLVEALGPTGLKAEKLGGLLGELQDRAHDRLQQLTGDGLGFVFEMEGGELRLLVDTGGARLPLAHLSQSERLRAGIALQDVLNSLTGLRLMVIDDCDVLDEDNRTYLTTMLQEIQQDYDTIIVIAARSTPPTAVQVPGWRWFWIKDGAAQVVE